MLTKKYQSIVQSFYITTVFSAHERIRVIIITLLLLFAVGIYGGQWQGSGQVASVAGTTNVLTVAFLDVGQGDGIYIETPDGVQMLVDGGPDGMVLRELSTQMPWIDKTLDVVLATHSDKDHIGGLISVLERYEVASIITTTNKNDTSVADLFSDRVAEEGATLYYAEAGQQYQLGASTTISIISPAGDPTNWESNSASIVLQVQYGEVSFLLTGDAGINIEEYLVDSYGDLLKSEVLKLGHHGSRTSSGELFLDTVRPEVAIVSAGADNSYGHPHAEVIEAVTARNIKILETAKEGTIVFHSDGEKVWAGK